MKTVLILAFIATFLIGALVGFFVKNSRAGAGLINLNPFPQSCLYNGKKYQPGESFASGDGCNRCSCQNGKIVCTLMGCNN